MKDQRASSASEESILQRLRRETQPSHMALEARVDLMNRITTAVAYRNLLEAFYGLFLPLEEELGRSQSDLVRWLPDIHDRMRHTLLKRDLMVLGCDAPEKLPMAVVPHLDSIAACLGCLYVLEGSRLGGQIISKHVAAHLGYTPENGCAFFFGRGAGTGVLWNRFRNGLESFASANPSGGGEIVGAAVATFQVFDRLVGPDGFEPSTNGL